jgi:hypothetical protein
MTWDHKENGPELTPYIFRNKKLDIFYLF